jgi:DNA-binding transcriptional regulator YiaG
MSRNVKLFPKNLNDMREKIAANLHGEISPEANLCRDLISHCENISIKEDALLTIKQAASMLGVSEQTLRNWEVSGKLVPQKTKCGHRRYSEKQINPLRKEQLSPLEILLPCVTPTKLRALGEMLLSSFKPDEEVTLIISHGGIDGKVRVTLDSKDGLTTITKTFDMEDE